MWMAFLREVAGEEKEWRVRWINRFLPFPTAFSTAALVRIKICQTAKHFAFQILVDCSLPAAFLGFIACAAIVFEYSPTLPLIITIFFTIHRIQSHS